MTQSVKDSPWRVLGPTGGWKRQAAASGLGLVIAAGFAVAEAGKPDPSSLKVEPLEVGARAITAFDRKDQGRARFGHLEWRGGVVLSSSSKNFGGWSGLVVGDGGHSFMAVSDAGTWLEGELSYEDGKLSAVSKARIGPIKARDGKTLGRGRDRDAESIVLEEGTLEKGVALVAFEQNDRIGRFPITAKGLEAPVTYLELPPEARSFRINGFESVAVLTGGPLEGSVVAFVEQSGSSGGNRGWIWPPSGKPRPLTISGAGGYDITDAKGLPDGSLLLLERRFRLTEGVKMRLSKVRAGDIGPGRTSGREVLLEAGMGQEIDNMEGLGLHTNAAGETIVTLVSDDNFNPLFQRTILLQFALDAEVDGTARPSRASAAARP